jgi:hypothetical protein
LRCWSWPPLWSSPSSVAFSASTRETKPTGHRPTPTTGDRHQHSPRPAQVQTAKTDAAACGIGLLTCPAAPDCGKRCCRTGKPTGLSPAAYRSLTSQRPTLPCWKRRYGCIGMGVAPGHATTGVSIPSFRAWPLSTSDASSSPLTSSGFWLSREPGWARAQPAGPCRARCKPLPAAAG